MKPSTSKLLALLAGGLALACHQVILTAPPGSSITVFANPEFIAANGGVSVISALVFEPAGTPVPDGTVVQFFTNLGRIDEQGKTNDGVARVNLVADSRSGTATVRAFSGGAATAPAPTPSASASPGPGTGTAGAAGSVQVVIGSALPARVDVTAFPQRITDFRQSTIRAFVYDQNGNPVSNVPVLFSVSQGATPTPAPTASPGPSPTPGPTPSPGADFLASRGTPVFTDNNGVAEDTLLVRTPHTDPQKTITITATTANGRTGSVAVLIN